MSTPRRRALSPKARSQGGSERSASSEPAKLLRLSRVDAVRRRIANGYYDRDEVRDRLAHAVLEAIREE